MGLFSIICLVLLCRGGNRVGRGEGWGVGVWGGGPLCRRKSLSSKQSMVCVLADVCVYVYACVCVLLTCCQKVLARCWLHVLPSNNWMLIDVINYEHTRTFCMISCYTFSM